MVELGVDFVLGIIGLEIRIELGFGLGLVFLVIVDSEAKESKGSKPADFRK